MLIRHSDYFKPLETKWRVFKAVARRADREIVRGALLGEDAAAQRHSDLRAAAAAAGPVARLIVDPSKFLIDANDRAREIFALGASDIGRPIQDLELSYRPLELRSPLDLALKERRAQHAGRVEWGDGSDKKVFDVEAAPILDHGGSLLGASISFTDVTESALLRKDFEQSKRELETAYEELQSTVEELETTNEELQSTNEELETTNEELQSANEELQTMNEELTSTNDELEALNDEQQHHASELDKANLFLEGILSNLAVSVVVVDKEGTVQLWNSDSRELWGLRPDEVEGREFMSLDIGLPLERLREPLDKALAMTPETTDLTLEAINRRGKGFRCEVRTMPLVSAKAGLYGAVVLMRDLDAAPGTVRQVLPDD